MVTLSWKRLARAGWRRWLLWLGLGTLVGGLLVWSGLNLVHDTPPAVLWTPDDLPSVPPEDDNGWQVVAAGAELVRASPAGAIDEVVRSAIAGDAASARPSSSSLRAAEQAWAQPEVRSAWEVCAGALAKPSFVDQCPIDFAARCPSLELAHCHRLASFDVLRAVAGGDLPGASEKLTALLRQDEGHLGSARSPVGMLVALRNLREALQLAESLVGWAREAGQPSALAPLEAQVAALDCARVDFESAVVGEYLLLARGVVVVERGDSESGELGLPGFFFDAGATLAELNQVYPAAAPAPGEVFRPHLPDRPYAAGFGWWVRNPLGKLYLDAVLPPAPVYDSLARERQALLAQHRRLLAELGRARPPARSGS